MKYRIIKDKVAGGVMTFFTLLSLILLVAMAVGLWLKSADILEEHSMWNLLTASEWKPMRNQFGFLAF
ncbi:MAG: phosphate ABC transporter permease subunit PstC, partial [Paludibacteraceae bacterium]|nr:phosphate ABC transporter permease subunit PstC [Paludibacteraceae bacterium]